jgi:hypothetical protein
MLHLQWNPISEDYQWVPACEGRDTIYDTWKQEPKHYNWVPACGGKETPFKGRDGKTYLYMWNGVSEHAYYCLEDDLFLEYGECVGRIYPEA